MKKQAAKPQDKEKIEVTNTYWFESLLRISLCLLGVSCAAPNKNEFHHFDLKNKLFLFFPLDS
jgi:hypothetical protein